MSTRPLSAHLPPVLAAWTALLAGCPGDPCPEGPACEAPTPDDDDDDADDDDGADDDDASPTTLSRGPSFVPADRPRGCEGVPTTPGRRVGFRTVASFTGDQTPVDVVDPADGTGRLIVGTRQGELLAAHPDGDVDVLLDVIATTGYPVGGEAGLASVALHPGFAWNGLLFVSRSDPQNTFLVERWAVLGDPATDPVDPASRAVLLSVPQGTEVHQGGHLLFGPDGMLYVALGDGGPTGGAFGISQDLTDLRGKILRLDVNGEEPYSIPADNPDWGVPGARGEIWAMGFRNPWRMTFDRQSGLLLVGDVGENRFEEVDLVRPGRNYGWPVLEGEECYPADEPCDPSPFEPPIHVYSHVDGIAVIGGHVYRGCRFPDLWGAYLHSDYGDLGSPLFAVDFDGVRMAPAELEVLPFKYPLFITSWGQDRNGELLLADQYASRVIAVVPEDEAWRP